MTYPFGDIRNVTNFNEFFALDLNPRVDHFINDEGHFIPPFNYPSIWTVFPYLGLSNVHTVYFGISFFILLSIGIYSSIKIESNSELLVYVLLLFSPVLSLIIERGNNDQVAFFLIVMFCCFFHKNKIISLIAYYLAFLTKFFPIVVIASLTERFSMKSFRLGFLLSLPIVIYITLTFPEVINLGKSTPISIVTMGYGWKTPISMFIKYTNENIIIGLSLFSLLLIVLFFFILKTPYIGEKISDLDKKYLMMFKSGMLIYIGTYFIGTSFDYRLIFLLLTIPLLLHLSTITSKITVAMIIFLFWSHQLILVALSLGQDYLLMKLLGETLLMLKVLAHYSLVLLLIYTYKSNFKILLFGRELNRT
jgi:hypothetical protein